MGVSTMFLPGEEHGRDAHATRFSKPRDWILWGMKSIRKSRAVEPFGSFASFAVR